MPETCFPIRTRRRVPIPSPVLTLLLIGAALGGCSGGDFGRTRQDFRNDDMHRWIGERGDRQASACMPRNSSSPTTNGSFAISPIP